MTLAVAARRKLSEVVDARAVSASKPGDREPDSGLDKAQIRMPRVDGREVRLQAVRSHAALLAQIPKIGDQVRRTCGEGRDKGFALLPLTRVQKSNQR